MNKNKNKNKNNRIRRIEIRLTQKEYDQLEKMVASFGRSVSGYIRAKLFRGECATINAVEFLRLYKMQLYEMQKTGNNINQLDRYANICIKNGKLSETVIQEMNQRLGELTGIEIKLEDAMRRLSRAR